MASGSDVNIRRAWSCTGLCQRWRCWAAAASTSSAASSASALSSAVSWHSVLHSSVLPFRQHTSVHRLPRSYGATAGRSPTHICNTNEPPDISWHLTPQLAATASGSARRRRGTLRSWRPSERRFAACWGAPIDLSAAGNTDHGLQGMPCGGLTLAVRVYRSCALLLGENLKHGEPRDVAAVYCPHGGLGWQLRCRGDEMQMLVLR